MLANFSGRHGEMRIAGILDAYGVAYKQQHGIGFTLFKQTKVDFFLTDLYIYVEVKTQTVAGSVDEKWPYLVMNIRQHYDKPTIVVLLGNAHNKNAIDWVKNWVDEGTLLGVFDEAQFKHWIKERVNHT